MTPIRVVMDTNCLVSSLVFSHRDLGELRLLWQSGNIVPVVCRESVAELIRVLGYPKFNLEKHAVESLLADILPWTEACGLPKVNEDIAALRDRDDAVFIHLAKASGAAFLVSGDRHLLELRKKFAELHIVTPAELLKNIRGD
jgi:putative PIN family toxin of toxin-antitoxin system